VVTRTARILAGLLCLLLVQVSFANEVRLKDLGRFLGWRDNMLVGYGIVTGLAGSGDSPRSRVTRQALANVLSNMGMVIPQDQMSSRNVAAVMITATLPPSANVGDKIDVMVTSISDARSLAGGSLLMSSLMGPDRQTYVLAQGPISVGGYRFDANQNTQQKNHPTVGILPAGGTVESPVRADLLTQDGFLVFVLKDPDVTTAERIARRINAEYAIPVAATRDAAAIQIRPPGDWSNPNEFVARIEGLKIAPDQRARVVINERTGTVVAGSDVQVSPAVIAQGDIKVSITTEVAASQPSFVGRAGRDVQSLVISNTTLAVSENPGDTVMRFSHTTVADLVQGLSKLRVSTRDMIAILQALKAAGALHADLMIQ